jgi:3-hydroxyisobutyrate dehydrogenase
MEGTIAILGAGLLGTGFARALRRRGASVRVWNRTRAKAVALTDFGVEVASSPADAVVGASRVHLVLSDDAAVDEVIAAARPGLGAGCPVIDHTTTSATGVAARVRALDAVGVSLLHAPVFMGPVNALESTGLMLTSGDAARIDRVRGALEAMTGRLVVLGGEPETAAAFKLLGNLHLMFLTAGLADMLELAKALRVEPSAAAGLFEVFNPGTTIGARLERMLQSRWDQASWELGMARKDARIMLEEAGRAGAKLEVLPAIASRMDELIAEGFGGMDWTVLARDALKR